MEWINAIRNAKSSLGSASKNGYRVVINVDKENRTVYPTYKHNITNKEITSNQYQSLTNT